MTAWGRATHGWFTQPSCQRRTDRYARHLHTARIHFARLQQASLCGTATARTMQGFDDRRRIVGGHLRQRERGTVGYPAPLFPIAERRHADADQEREFRLRLAEIGAHRFHVGRLERAGT